MIGYNYSIEILRLSLKNLIEYNLTHLEKLTVEEIMTLEKIIIYQACESTYVYQSDDQQKLEKDQNGHLIDTYEDSFINQLVELEKTFMNYIKEAYGIKEELISQAEMEADMNLWNIELYLTPEYESQYPNETISHLFELFPKLKTIISRIPTISSYSYTKVLELAKK